MSGWSQTTISQLNSKTLKKLLTLWANLDFYKKSAKDFKKTRRKWKYVLTHILESGDQFKELMVAVANASSETVNAEAFNNVEFKNVSIKLVV